jgi:acetyl esterase/lipase
MASLRSRIVRFMIKHMVGPKFRRAGHDLAELRKLDAFAIKNQKVPAGTEVTAATAGSLPAEWVCAPGVAKDRVILLLHGGAFVMGSPATHRELAALLSAFADAAVFVPDYRLAPEHPYPAAMHDAIDTYRWLLDQGHDETRIVIGGDSAGGGLTLQTLIALRDDGIPLPAAAFLLSPITDWVRFDGESYTTRADVDPMNSLDLCRFTASLYVGDNDPGTPLLYPADMDLAGLPPLCIHVGDREVVLSDSLRLAEQARACHVEIEFKIWPGMWHVFHHCARIVPEARRSLEEIARFIAQQVNNTAMESP